MIKENQFEVVYKRYEPLLKSLAKRYALRGDYEEAFAVAALALYEAFLQFDPQKGYFAPYAKRYISGRLLNHFRKEVRYRSQHVVPSAIDDEGSNWEEYIVAKETLPHFYLSDDIVQALTHLSPREQKAIIHVYVADRSLEELARIEGVTHSTVSTWKRRGLAKLQKLIRSYT